MTSTFHGLPALVLTRREALLAPLGVWVAAALGCGGGEEACVDDELLSTGERSLRRSLRYVETSPHEESRRCGSCHFFEAAASGACGSCSILGGPVAASGHCDSFSPRRSEGSATG